MKATRKELAIFERNLKSLGAYKPYASIDDGVLFVESYPLMAIVRDGFDRELGPLQTVKVTDCTMSREGKDPVIATAQVLMGSPLAQAIATIFTQHHTEAHERAKAQDAAVTSRAAA